MTQKEIISNNKLIAEFMGYKLAKCNNGLAWNSPYERSIEDKFDLHGRLFYPENHQYYISGNSYLKFDKDWTWLILVVDKIVMEDVYAEEKAKVMVSLCPQIETVYSAIINFINWYNSDSPKRIQP